MVEAERAPLGPLPAEAAVAYEALLQLVPCPLCGRTACDTCWAEAGAQGPARLSQADDRFWRAWRLRGGSLLLVGARVAELRGPRGGLVFVPDEDVHDPARRRVRGVAAWLGLPLDMGVGWAGTAQVPESQVGMVWQRERHGLDWTGALDGGGDGVDPRMAGWLPEAPSPEVLGERAAGVAALFGYLRKAAPPPEPPRLLAVESREVERFELVEGGLRRTVERYWPNGGCERLAVEEAPFAPSDEAAYETARPVAVAALGPVRAHIDGLHRSYVLTCVTPDGIESGWMAAEPGTDPVTELALARFAATRGLGPDARFGVSPVGAPPGPERFACPTSAHLVERRVTERWVPYPAEELPWARPVEAADLRELGIPPVAFSLASVLGTLAQQLLPVARRLDAAPEGRRWTMACEAEVTETWAGGGTGQATRTYLVRPGQLAWPPLDDGGHLLAEFGVDDFGHLHAPHGSWVCPACERHRCRACGPDGELAACDACGQAACGSCRNGEPVAVPPASCARCGARSCGTCHRQVGASACVLCARPVCRRCRGRDDRLQAATFCVECAAPVRLPEADQRFGRAWAIGGGRCLLVGERSAMLVGREGEPRVFVPDADRDDPVRRRVRALAAVLRLPPETGFRCTGAPPRPVPGPLTAWMAVRADVEWSWVPDTGSSVDRFMAEVLPEAPATPEPSSLGPPPVDGEESAGIAELLARLREEAPPPPVGGLQVRPFVEVTRVEVAAGGLEWRRERHWTGGDVETVETRHAPFERSTHPVDRPARPVAAATLGPVRATLDAVHASYVVTTSVAGSQEGSRSWFVPGAPGLTLNAEIAWASLALAAGFGAGARIYRQRPAPRVTDEDFAQPGHADLVERTVRESWRLVPGFPDDGVAGPRELALIGHPAASPATDDGPPAHPSPPAGLLATARRLDRLAVDGERVTLARFLEVSERWQGRGSADRSYLVAPGARPWPTLDDRGEEAEDFGVDEAGHLYDPQLAWECLVCERIRCLACGPEAAQETCGGCGQPVCRSCRLAAEEARLLPLDADDLAGGPPGSPVEHPPPPAPARPSGALPQDEPAGFELDRLARCERCSARSCGACGRRVRTAECGLCRRQVCQRCRRGPDGCCRTCGELREANELERAALPAELATAGLRVLLAEDGDVTVAVLLGRHRRELAVLRGAGRLVRWETMLADPPELLSVRLAVARIAGGEVAIRQAPMALPPQLDPASLVLRCVRDDVLDWTLLDADGTPVEGNRVPEALPPGIGDPDRQVAELAEPSPAVLGWLLHEAGWGTVVIPDPAAPGLSELLSKVLLTAAPGGPDPAGARPSPGPAERGPAPPMPRRRRARPPNPSQGPKPDERNPARLVARRRPAEGPDPGSDDGGQHPLAPPAPVPRADLPAPGTTPHPAPDAGHPVLLLAPQRREERVWLDADGLHHGDFDGQAMRQADALWSLQTIPAWAQEGWSPPLEVVFGAELDGFEAVVVRAGEHVALGVKGPDDDSPRWGTLRERREELTRLAAGAAFSPGQGLTLLEVAELTDPAQVVGPELIGGQLVRRRTSVVLRRLEPGPGVELTEEALAAFAEDLVSSVPGGEPLMLPAALAAELLPRVDQVPCQIPRYQVGLGLLVEETWTLDGDEVPLVYELAPGEQRGRVHCQETGASTASVLRDREGHLVAAALTCRYCGTRSCGLCFAPAWPCGVCQIIVCGYCGQTPGDRAPRCPACRDLRPASWMERRHYSAMLAPRGRVLLGRDRLHQVALVETLEGWQLLILEDGRYLPPTPLDTESADLDLIKQIAAVG